MTSSGELYRIAQKEHITVDFFELAKREALSIQDDNESCYIAINPKRIVGYADQRTKLAHELGHCVKRAFYNQYSPIDDRGKCEETARRWSIETMLPFVDMCAAMAEGYTEPYQLADYFSVTESLVKQAYAYYTEACGLCFE